MAEREQVASQNPIVAANDTRRWRLDGPFWLALLLSVSGIVFFLLGSVTILPWISDETEVKSVRSIWLALSRNLPDLGPDALVRFGFWLLIALVAVLAIGLLFLASTVRDEPEPGADQPA